MLSRTICPKLKRISQMSAVLRGAVALSLLLTLGAVCLWWVVAIGRSSELPVTLVSDGVCPQDCKADEHCNSLTRSCEPNTTFAAAILPSGGFDNKVKKVFSARM